MALPFSEFVEKNGFIFVSGQVPLNDSGEMLDGTIEEKTHQVMKNLQKVLISAGASLTDVVKTTIFLTEMSDFDKVNGVYASYFEGNYPARETICVKALPLNSEIEISMIASKS
jgi:2-iminobutanoate/2-iminopropanoate deaminase